MVYENMLVYLITSGGKLLSASSRRR